MPGTERKMAMSLRSPLVPVSWGELLDKITILEIKAERIADPARRANVEAELRALLPARHRLGGEAADITGLVSQLKRVNERLWDIEDAIRLAEKDQDFGPRFVRLARDVYHTNDQRAVLKRRINDRLGSDLVEEKSYAAMAA
jgi:hypothetical protein